MELGIVAICAIVVAAFRVVTAVREILPKLDLGDIPRVIDIIRNSMSILKNAPQAAKEFRDLDDAERAGLGALVKSELLAQGVNVENVDLLTERALTAIDAVWDFVSLLPKKG